MKKITNLLMGLILALPVLGFVAVDIHADTDVETYTVGGTEVWNIDNTGAVNSGGAATIGGAVILADNPTSPTLPTTANAANFSVKVPIQNATGATIPQGGIVISSQSATGVALAASGAFADSTDIIGIADADILAGANGFISVAGYALLLTTGTVVNGDILVSTDGANGAQAAGYTITDNTPTAGTAIGKAIGAGTASGGLTPVIITLH